MRPADPNRFGHYVVSGETYFNKLTAVRSAVSQGHWIHWNFNESVFGKVDWTQEPQASLTQLYDQRARQIRDTYEFVALEFSGGADSWNMLAAFCRQGLPVDLVVHKIVQSAVGDEQDLTSENHWAEGLYQAWRWFQHFQQQVPSLKWYTWDIEQQLYDAWADVRSVDIMFQNNLHPGSLLKFPGITNINPAGIPELPTTAYLVGIDKPIVELHHDGWYLVFYDHPVLARAAIEKSRLIQNWTDLLFYWDPDCVQLLAKQAHTVRNFFRSTPKFSALLKTAGPKAWDYKNLVAHLIYPGYQQYWQSQKPRGSFAFTSEAFFIDQIDHPSVQNWHQTLLNYQDQVLGLTKGTEFERYTHSDTGSRNYTVLADCPSVKYYLGPP